MTTSKHLMELGTERDTPLERVLAILHGVRAALADLLHSADCDPSKTRETARRLGLSRGLVWRLSTIVASNDMAIVAQRLPSPKSAEALFSACRDRGAPDERVHALRSALDEYERAVERFSGDRKSLEMILNNAAGGNITDQQEQARKQAAQANSTIWGVQAKLQLRSCFLAPGESADRRAFTYASVSGLLELRRLRSVTWPIHVASTRGDKSESIEGAVRPIDPSGSLPGGPPVMLEYSSTPVPEIREILTGTGTVYEVAGGVLGKLGSSTVVCGSLFSHTLSPGSAKSEGELGMMNFLTHLHTPVEHLHVDLFLHKDLACESEPEVILIDRMLHPHAAAITNEEVERKRMPMSIGLRELAPGAEGAVTQHIPWYPRMMRDVCVRGRWAPGDFRGYRLEMSFPPNPTALAVGVRMSSPK